MKKMSDLKKRMRKISVAPELKDKSCYAVPKHKLMPLHGIVFHGCACTDYACEFYKTSVWTVTPKYRPGPFTPGDRGHVEAYLITLYEDGRNKKVIPQETTFKQFTQKCLPKAFYDWLTLEGIWEDSETPGTQTVATKQRMKILNAPLNCGGDVYYVTTCALEEETGQTGSAATAGYFFIKPPASLIPRRDSCF